MSYFDEDDWYDEYQLEGASEGLNWFGAVMFLVGLMTLIGVVAFFEYGC